LPVIGSLICGNHPDNDHFVDSHGINTPEATKKRLDHYLVSVDDPEPQTGEKIPVADYVKHDKSDISWLIPYGCHRG
jgi:endonuclease G, mitochondrial